MGLVKSAGPADGVHCRGHPSGAANQARVLREENVVVETGSLGEFVVDLTEYGWFPHQLPSDTAAGLEPFDDPRKTSRS